MTTESRRITVDYGNTLEEMIAAGNYDSVNGLITPDRFRMNGTGIEEFDTCLLHLAGPPSWMKSRYMSDPFNLFSVKIERLLAYGAATREEYYPGPIIGLGSIIEHEGYYLTPFICSWDAKRILDLRWVYYGWDPSCRFLKAFKM